MSSYYSSYSKPVSDTIADFAFVLAIFAVIGAIICGIVYGIVSLSRTAGHASCNTFARTSGYTTKFRLMHFLDTGSCLVQTPSGKWMSQDRVLVTLHR